MVKLSVVIMTMNEEKVIARCLESVKWADEVILVDDASTDRTIEIARGYTQNILFADSHGAFENNRNLGIDKAQGEWILSVDADEVISPELREEIKQAINESGKIGFFMPRKNYFLSKWIRGCGWWPDYILRLFRKDSFRWPKELHQTPEIKDSERGKIGYLKNPFIHYSYTSFRQYFEKFNRYTSELAFEDYQKGFRINRLNFVVCFLVKPCYWFVRKYFFRGGICDGYYGFFVSISSALVIFVSHAKLWELQNECKE